MDSTIDLQPWVGLSPWPQAQALARERAASWWARAQAAQPAVRAHHDALMSCIAGHLGAACAQGASPQAWADNLLVEELALAVGCARGEPQALERFEAVYGEHLQGLARRHEGEQLKTQDLLQILRQKLFVGPQPRILDYAGQGALRSWLQITAVRAFIDATRSAASRAKSEELVEGDYFERMLDEGQDLELDFLKQTYKDAFKASFAQAVEALTPRQRNLLAQSVGAGLSIDQLGALYGVHRATAARWLQDARQALSQQLRLQMMQRLEVDAGELHSIMNLIQSRASLSLSRLCVVEPDEP